MATTLCKKLKLSIEVNDAEGGEQIQVTLTNDMTLEELVICYPVGTNTTQKRYHRREAMVIAMRRLISQAVEDGMILDSRGVSLDLSGTLGSNSHTTSSTGQDASLLSLQA